MKKFFGLMFCLALPVASRAEAPAPRFTFELEGGPAIQSRNDVRIPSTGGTDVDLKKKSVFGYGRIQAVVRLAERHELRALWAPNQVTAAVSPGQAVNFNGQVFPANQPIDTTYQFNSYRLTYRYRLSGDGASFRAWVGFTAKIRDAFIRFRQGATTTTNANVGFVPLLHFSGSYRFDEKLEAIVDVDGLAAPQGRAFDVLLGLRYTPCDQLYFGAGYRTFEGGVSNDTTHNYTWLHFLALSAGVRF